MKRWIDNGRLPAQVTTGGHRRIEVLQALRFLHTTKRQLVDPSLVGLTDPALGALADSRALEERLHDHLRSGRSDRLEQDLLVVLAMGLLEPAELFDVPLRGALERIGELWHGDHRGIYVEHRATVALSSALDRVQALYEVPEHAPVAVGGSIAGDPSLVPTKMVATVLAGSGYRTVDLGANTPMEALLEATDHLKARLVWLSVSYVTEARLRTEEVTRLLVELNARGTSCVMGGREIHRLELPQTSRARIGRDVRELTRLADHVMRDSDD